MAPVDEKKGRRPSCRRRVGAEAFAGGGGLGGARAEQLAERAQAGREHHASLDAVFEIVDTDVEVGGGIIAGALSFRLFLWLLPLALVFVGGLGVIAGVTSDSPKAAAHAVGHGGSRLERVPEHREELERLVRAACRRAAADLGDAERTACADRRPPAGVGRRARRRAEADHEGVRRASCLASLPLPPGRSRELAEGPVGRAGRGRDDRGRGGLRRRLATHLAAAAAPRRPGRRWFPERSLSVSALA